MLYQTKEGLVEVTSSPYIGAIYCTYSKSTSVEASLGLKVAMIIGKQEQFLVPYAAGVGNYPHLYWQFRTDYPAAGKGRNSSVLQADRQLTRLRKKDCHLRYKRWQTLHELDRRLHSSV